MKLNIEAAVEAMRAKIVPTVQAAEDDDADALFEIVLETGVIRSDGSPVQVGLQPAPGARLVLHDRGATLSRLGSRPLLGPANQLLGTLVRRYYLQVLDDRLVAQSGLRPGSIAAAAMRLAQASAALDCALDAFGAQP